MPDHKNLTPHEVQQKIQHEGALLIDVREQDEYDDSHIAGAILLPLSRFNPQQVPDPAGKPVIFYCAGGVRSVRVMDFCLQAGLPYDAHMAGGIRAWKSAGLPTEK